jgi:hypothetical protein
MALIFALVLGRLLKGLTPCLNAGRRYPVQVAWIFVLLLVCVLQWWALWTAKEVAWTPIRFLWVLAIPGLIYVRASVLTGENPEAVDSFRDHFFKQRVRFFSLGLAQAGLASLTLWVLGLEPWLSVAPIHRIASILATLSIAGLVFESTTAHAIIVSLNLMLAAASFFLLPVIAPPA